MNDHLFYYKKRELMPNSFRWFVGQNLIDFTPWRFCGTLEEFSFASKQFRLEDNRSREVFAIMRREDMDDFAGFEIKDGELKENIIYFHPSFNGSIWKIERGTYSNLFEFFKNVVLRDMEEWALTEDFEDYKNEI